MLARMDARGWTSTPIEATKCFPEALHALALIAPLDRIPSVRFLDAAVWVSHGAALAKKAEPFRPIGNLLIAVASGIFGATRWKDWRPSPG